MPRLNDVRRYIRPTLPQLVISISIIIPTWNEESELPACLQSIGELTSMGEVILCDGGSSDRTREIATAAGARVLNSPRRQRGVQLNHAAREARGEVLLFLHADTQLPSGWWSDLQSLFSRHPQIIGGAFKRRFDHPSLWLRITSWLADWRGRIWGTYYGDQAMFVRISAFRELGGFHHLDRCEDLDLALRMANVGPTRMIKRAVKSSGRRFLKHGPIRQTWMDFLVAREFIRTHPQESDRPGDLEASL